MVEEVANRVSNHATKEHIQTRAESPNIHAALQDVANSLIALGESTKILIESAKKTPYHILLHVTDGHGLWLCQIKNIVFIFTYVVIEWIFYGCIDSE